MIVDRNECVCGGGGGEMGGKIAKERNSLPDENTLIKTDEDATKE